MTTEKLTEQDRRVALWDAINEYVAACGGDSSKRVYGNTSRQRAVAAVERVSFGHPFECDADLRRLREENERLAKLNARATRLANRTDPPGDWACAECQPSSEILIAGFRCDVHALRSEDATSTKEHHQ